MKNLVIGILAHVDAGKTTLSESMLYLSGKIRELGRVDHGDAFLDTYALERARGITIFSKQAVFSVEDTNITLLDTPGHVDFSAEMERSLRVLDYAVLVINGADGIQGHTQTLWSLLRRYHVPVFLFVNKMDQAGTDRDALLAELQKRFGDGCIDFGEEQTEEWLENIAVCDEHLLEQYMENGNVEHEDVVRLIAERKVFPCYFGSALKLTGVQELLEGLSRYTKQSEEVPEFGAKIYKISRDIQGNRLTHLKITGGNLKVKDILRNVDGEWEEKVNQIRIYSGEKFESVAEAGQGCVCAVTGLTKTCPGEGLGFEDQSEAPVLEPVLSYRIELPEGVDAHKMLLKLKQLEEEDPQLHIEWNEQLGEIHAKLMGEVQIEILESLIKERFDVPVTFGTGNIVYKETIADTVEGVGHFEPLRHYAEVHLLLEAGERGSGLVFDTNCSEDVLDKNWQRLILTHLMEKEHRGVLTGSAITDMKITLIAGRAHLKHTEGGDFRQSTYRAVRQGLMQAESVLLEPYYRFRLEVPAEMVGRAMTDIQRMYGESEAPVTEGDMTILEGSAPVAAMRDYQLEVAAYTKGRGRLACMPDGYRECHNAEEVVEELGYDPERDLENPAGSVFCTHGAGFNVSWDKVFEYMHIPRAYREEEKKPEKAVRRSVPPAPVSEEEEKELEEIFMRTYGKIERAGKRYSKVTQSFKPEKRKAEERGQEYLLVDGYNVIFAWDELKELARDNIEAARNKLMDILCNYQGYKKCILILVFDAYKVDGFVHEIQKYHNIHVVYTKEAETADQYIEKVVHEIGKKYHVTVATSDRIEQVITLGQGGTLISSRELREEIELMQREIREEYLQKSGGKNYLFNHMDEELAEKMEQVRLGKEEINER